jgi:hypothetical protein
MLEEIPRMASCDWRHIWWGVNILFFVRDGVFVIEKEEHN